MMILHGNENKVYGGREMDMEIYLNNFMHARLDGYFKRNDNKQKIISLLNPLIWPKNVLLFSHFLIRKIPRIWWQAKWETIWIYFSAFVFVYFPKFMLMHAVCLNLWITTKWNAMHVCASQGTYSHDNEMYVYG